MNTFFIVWLSLFFRCLYVRNDRGILAVILLFLTCFCTHVTDSPKLFFIVCNLSNYTHVTDSGKVY